MGGMTPLEERERETRESNCWNNARTTYMSWPCRSCKVNATIFIAVFEKPPKIAAVDGKELWLSTLMRSVTAIRY
jgi:hypothetical protein